MGKLRNRIVNTLGITTRTVKTAGRTTIDTTKSALNVVLDPFIGIGKTSLSIKDAIHKSFTEGPWYRKLWKVPTSLALSPLMLVEGAVETLWGTGVNACSSVRDIIGNTLTNEGTAIKMMGKSEKFKFTTDKLEYKRLSPRNRLASLFGTKTEEEAQKQYFKTREKLVKQQEDRIKKERQNLENWRNERRATQEKLEQERRDWRDERKNEHEKAFQSLKEERDAFNKQKEQLSKRISILEQEKKNLENVLKNTKKEVTDEVDKKTNVVKFEPKVEKKEVADEGNQPKIVKINTKPEEKTAATEVTEAKKSA